MIEENKPIIWKPERAYYKGRSEGADILLYYKDDTGHKIEKITGFPFYFLIKYEDFRTYHNILKDALAKKKINKLERHPFEGHGKWVRVYITKYIKPYPYFTHYDESGEWNRWETKPDKNTGKINNVVDVVSRLENAGLKCYEADLTPLHRFLTDHQVTFDMKLKRCYLDLETDDTKGGFDDESLKKNRILSYAIYNDQGKNKFEISASNNDAGERALLMKLYNDVKAFDVMCAWNGTNFDFKVLRFRMTTLGIGAWNNLEKRIIHCDLLEASKRNAPSGEFKSFALGNVGEAVCGLKKIDHTGVKIIELWTNDKQKLKEYNLRDSEIMWKIEKIKAYQQNDMRIAALGHRFSNYFNISSKVEGRILYEANLRGIHYPTIYNEYKDPTKYEGGFVQEPICGMYDNVATLDFSSLYPSLISTYNISHDVMLTESEKDTLDPKDIITPPCIEQTKCWFRKDVLGLVPELLQNLNKERHKYEALKDKCVHDSEEYWGYYWTAVVHKTFVLSFYGALGDPKSRFFDERLARSITLSGQFYIQFVAKVAKSKGYTSLYQDTDSIFLQIEENEIQDFLDYTHKTFDSLAKKHNCLPGFMKLNYENYFTRVVFVKKKRYGGCLKIHKGKEVKDFIHVRGLETRRSDIPVIAKDVLNDTMKMLFVERQPKEKFVKMLIGIREKIMKNKVTREEITICKSVSKKFAEYKGDIIDKKTGKPKIKKDGTTQQKAIPLHVKIAERMVRRGREYYTGSQIPYIVTGTAPLTGVHEDEYQQGDYDKSYYFDMQVYEPSKRLLEIAFDTFDWETLYIDAKAASKADNDE